MAAHTHSHGHRRSERVGRAFAIGIALNVAFVVVEIAFGVLANSLALVTDAIHNCSDVLGLVLAWGASALARRPPTIRFTYGLRGSTILAALANAMLLLVVSGGIAWEAILRLRDSGAVNESVMMWIAALGVLVNGGTAWLFMADRRSDLNLRGVYLHMVADAAVSFGVVVAGAGIMLTGWRVLDPAASLVIVLVIFISTWTLLRDAVKLALHAAPENVDPALVRRYLNGLPGVAEAHDLHVWGMSTTETAMTVHLVMPSGHPGDEFLARIVDQIEHQFHIGHVTIQIETGSAAKPCVLAPEHVV